jgi:histone acetyltransferase (RNA polymerase elongator complex component)
MIVPFFLPHLGCGQRCTYCNQDIIASTGQQEPIEARIDRLLSPLAAPAEIGLYAGNFLGLDPEAMESLFRHFERYRARISGFRVSAKPGRVSTEILAIMKRQGVHTVELGIPSFNDRILSSLRRGHTREDLFRTYGLLRSEGFEMGLQVMVGLPEEAPGDVRETFSSLVNLAPAFIRIYPLLVIEGTPLAEDYREGRFIPDTIARAVVKALFIFLSTRTQGIRTIKMGLSENEVLKASILAGPYHPAFGYLVKSEGFFLALSRICEQLDAAGHITVHLHKNDVAHLTGYRRSNLKRLQERGIVAEWIEAEVAPGTFTVEAGGKKAGGTLEDALAIIPF